MSFSPSAGSGGAPSSPWGELLASWREAAEHACLRACGAACVGAAAGRGPPAPRAGSFAATRADPGRPRSFPTLLPSSTLINLPLSVEATRTQTGASYKSRRQPQDARPAGRAAPAAAPGAAAGSGEGCGVAPGPEPHTLLRGFALRRPVGALLLPPGDSRLECSAAPSAAMSPPLCAQEGRACPERARCPRSCPGSLPSLPAVPPLEQFWLKTGLRSGARSPGRAAAEPQPPARARCWKGPCSRRGWQRVLSRTPYGPPPAHPDAPS